MAWQKGPHGQAPQGVLCYGSDDMPGEVAWDDEGLANMAKLPPPPPERPQLPFKPPMEQQQAAAAVVVATTGPAPHAPAAHAGTKHG